MNTRRHDEREPGATTVAGTALCAVAADGAIEGGNGRLAVLLGLPLDELVGTAIEQFLPGVLALADEVPHDVIGHRADGPPRGRAPRPHGRSHRRLQPPPPE